MAELITGLDGEVVARNLERVEAELAEAARRAGRAAPARVLAATKYVADDEIPLLVTAGLALLGENRAQDLARKATAHAGLGVEWHFIGMLQSRKVKQILPFVTLIHSVATDSAVKELHKHGTADTRVLVEVNVAGEPGKGGVAPAELPAFLERAGGIVTGLMTMPPLASTPEDSRAYFAALRELAERHGLSELSMGTSQDYVVAAEEGSTIVRIGTSLYR